MGAEGGIGQGRCLVADIFDGHIERRLLAVFKLLVAVGIMWRDLGQGQRRLADDVDGAHVAELVLLGGGNGDVGIGRLRLESDTL